jgi:PKD repeat protein
MCKSFTKRLISFLSILVITLPAAFSQTITIGNIDPGPYGQGSTIAVPFHINNASGCISQNNIFSLYISDANGNFTSATAVDTIQNFYGTFFNFTVPNGTPAGTGYRFEIKASNPAITTTASNAFTISANGGVHAAVTSQYIANDTTLNAFGTCSGNNNVTYTFNNQSAAGATVTGTFFNELTQTAEATAVNMAPSYNFTANAANYTVTIKAQNNGIVSTYAYTLVNNVVNSNIGITGNPSVCITGPGGSSAITYNIDYQSPSGIQNNYPGNFYEFSWGDGSPVSIYTLCQIEAAGGKISHIFTKASCGITSNNQVNSFEIDFKIKNLFCGQVGSTATSYAKVIQSPFNGFTGSTVACTGSTVTFTNTSNPGPDPNATSSTCADNPNALYTWLVDGIVVQSGYKLSQAFTYQFTSPGFHGVTLQLQNGSGPCIPADSTIGICIQNPPQPNFTIPNKLYCLSGGTATVTPVNTSVVDTNCNKNNKFIWTVTTPTGANAAVTYAANTNANSAVPQFVFSNTGVYIISLSIFTQSCGTVAAPQQDTIVVNAPPVAVLSKDYALCGAGTVVFNANPQSPSYTILTGTAQQQAGTFTWNVSGGNYRYAAGYTANSQYPHIIFLDNSATYTITVTQTNNCGSVTSAPQHITTRQAPTVVAGTDTTICQGNSLSLNGTITGNYNNFMWTGGSGTFTPDRNHLQTSYTPSAAEINAGTVTLALVATTNLVAPCDTISSPINITIIPADVVTSAGSVTICTNQSVNYTITDKNNQNTFTWTASLTSGAATGFTNGSGNMINDVINNTNPTVTAVITYTIIPVTSGCPGIPFTFTVTVPAVPILQATAASSVICSNQPGTINISSNQAGASFTWVSTSSSTSISGNTNQSTPIATTAIQDIITNNGNAAGSVTYIITPYNNNGCAGAPDTVTLTVQPLPITSKAGADTTLCNAQTFTLQGNNPSPGNGLWTQTSGPAVVFADNSLYNTVISGLTPGNVYQFSWTISTAPGCQSVSSVVITDDLPTAGGTTNIAGSTTFCAGSNSGQITLSGQVGNVLYWQQSVDNGATWQNLVNSTTTQTFLNLLQTTQYRAVVQSGICNSQVSTVTTITINQPVVQSVAGADQSLCNVTSTTLNANNPGTSPAVWRQTSGPLVTIADSSNFQTAVTGLQPGNAYTFSWTIIGQAPCVSSVSSLTVTDNADVVASFTQSAHGGCGNTTVQFTNTSNNQAVASFLWDFGDGIQSTAVNPSHTFQQRTDGRDTTYYVTLSVLNNCVSRPPVTDSISIAPATPIARILPNQTTACGDFTLDVKNVSPGTNVSYVFYLYQGSTLIQQINKTDKSDAVFNPIKTAVVTTYSLFMVTTSFCGTTDETVHIPITISPPSFVAQTFAANNLTSGCAPFTTQFVNNASGGSTFYYSIYDANNNLVAQPVAGLANLSYTFTTAGNYTVTLTAANDCGAVTSQPISITVYPVPVADFMSAVTSGCRNISVQFTNLTADNGSTPAASLSYDWDYGDGSPHASGFTPPSHVYNFAGSPYTVTLTATNLQTGCTAFTTKSGYITVNPPPSTAFTESPDSVTSIPNYHFSFMDKTTPPPVSWNWSFGDGQTSTRQNPEITYADTGLYKVTLTTTNAEGCDSTVTHVVRVTGVPGQLYLPNAFIPSSGTTELKVFMAKGSGIKEWHMQIFNNYGQLVWETTKLNSKGAPVDGWDGTFQGTPAPQGVYIWQVSATFINGTQWKGMSYNNSVPKRIGSVNLIR